VIFLAILFIARYRNQFFQADPASSRRLAFRVSIVLLPVGVFLSLPAVFALFGSRITLPNAAYLIGSHISWWRIYARFGILVLLGLAILAAFGIDGLVRERTRWRTVLVAGVLAVTAVELVPGYPIRVYRVARETAASRWLAAHPGGIVAVYPMTDSRLLTPPETLRQWNRYNWTALYTQVLHGHALYSTPTVPIGNSRGDKLRRASSDLRRPLTARMLRASSVRYVLVDFNAYRLLGEKPPDGLKQLTALADFGNARIYSLTGPKLSRASFFRPFLTPAVKLAGGFAASELYAGDPARWMIQDGEILINNPNSNNPNSNNPPIEYELTLRGFSNGVPRTVALVAESGRVLGKVVVGTSDADVDMPVRLPSGSSHFRLHVTPKPARLGRNDPRVTSIFVRRISVGPAYRNFVEQAVGQANRRRMAIARRRQRGTPTRRHRATRETVRRSGNERR